LYLILPTVVKVIRKRFCCSSEVFGPKETAFGSEAPDKDALVLGSFNILV